MARHARRCWYRDSYRACFYRGSWHGVQRFYDYRLCRQFGVARPRNSESRGDPRYGRGVHTGGRPFPSVREPHLPIERDRRSGKGIYVELMNITANGNFRVTPQIGAAIFSSWRSLKPARIIILKSGPILDSDLLPSAYIRLAHKKSARVRPEL